MATLRTGLWAFMHASHVCEICARQIFGYNICFHDLRLLPITLTQHSVATDSDMRDNINTAKRSPKKEPSTCYAAFPVRPQSATRVTLARGQGGFAILVNLVEWLSNLIASLLMVGLISLTHARTLAPGMIERQAWCFGDCHTH